MPTPLIEIHFFSNRFGEIIYLKYTIYVSKTIKPLLIIRLYLIDWMIKGTGYQNGQK